MVTEKIYKVDRKRATQYVLRICIFIELSLLLLRDNFDILKTLEAPQFWWLTVMIFILGLFNYYWLVKEGNVMFKDNIMINYKEIKKEIDVRDFSAIRNTKKIFGKCLGLEYREPKGIIVRELFEYTFYSTATLQKILTEIVTINPRIELDGMAKQMLTGTFENK